MKRRQLVDDLRRAEIELAAAKVRFANDFEPWDARLRAHRMAVLVGGGLMAGVLFAGLPGRALARVIGFATGVGSLLLRTPLGGWVIAAVAAARSGRHQPSNGGEGNRQQGAAIGRTPVRR